MTVLSTTVALWLRILCVGDAPHSGARLQCIGVGGAGSASCKGILVSSSGLEYADPAFLSDFLSRSLSLSRSRVREASFDGRVVAVLAELPFLPPPLELPFFVELPPSLIVAFALRTEALPMVLVELLWVSERSLI